MTKLGSDHWVEIAIAFLLALSTLGTAYSGYQAALWGGVQATSYSQAGAKRTEAARVYNEAGQLRVYDVVVMIEWMNAFLEGNQEKADFYQERFRSELGVAFDAWWATDPGSQADFSGPFQREEYQLSAEAEAYALELEAEALFEEGRQANAQSDDYVLNTVFLASVLFFTGIASRSAWLPVRIALVSLAGLVFLFGVYNLLTFPSL